MQLDFSNSQRIRRSSDDQLTGLIRAEWGVFLIHHAHIDEIIWSSDAACFSDGVFGRQGKETGAIFCHPKTLFEADSFFCGVFFDQGNWQGCAAAGAKTQTAHVGSFPIRGLGHDLVHGGNPGKDCDFLPFYQIQHLLWVELAGQDGCVPKDDLGGDIGEQAPSVEEWENA